MVIGVVAMIAAMALIASHILESERARTEINAHVTTEMDRLRAEIGVANKDAAKNLRLQTCVLLLTPQERLEWRTSREPQSALLSLCPGLLLGGT